MKIDLYMRDENGIKARIVAEGQGWDALDVRDIETVKRFEPCEYCEIVLFRDDGSIYRHGFFPFLGGEDS
jgi:hypothetical protein